MMLVQSPSKIFKSDFSVWKKENLSLVNEIFSGEENIKLKKAVEIIVDENEVFDFHYPEKSSILVIVLYGEILINDFEKPISSEQIFTLQSIESNILKIQNHLPNEKADILLLEFKNRTSETFFSVENLNLNEKNTLIQISENLKFSNFIGLYDGREEQEYALYKKGKSIFGMVINGAFEFQNRLMETRDAILLSEVEILEFEALSENALILFFEV
ncbi:MULTISPECIES: hypothetical protein [unclassified Chryseobacterium]|uniref:pirin family protein n=1 Tax=unclassified Chryseobacterium TaxID=2593645 RepID=UPI00226980A9|nr:MULTISPECIES: hypothetical protein [unclassified Chryseobacterium]